MQWDMEGRVVSEAQERFGIHGHRVRSKVWGKDGEEGRGWGLSLNRSAGDWGGRDRMLEADRGEATKPYSDSAGLRFLREGEKRWPHPLRELPPHLGFARARGGGEEGSDRGGLALRRDWGGRGGMHWAAEGGACRGSGSAAQVRRVCGLITTRAPPCVCV